MYIIVLYPKHMQSGKQGCADSDLNTSERKKQLNHVST